MRETPSPYKLFGTLLLGGALCAFAQVDTTTAKALATTTVQVTVRPQDHVASAPILLTPADWEGRSLSLADVLAQHAGIQTRRTGGMGSFQAISIRGIAGNKVLICVDGIPLGDSDGMAQNLGSIDLNQLERIEVYKGQVPASFGGVGLGGVINLVTRQKSAHGGQVSASYGSHNTGEASVTMGSLLTDSTRWNSSLSWRYSDNDYQYLDRNGTLYNTTDDVYRKRRNAQYAQFSGNHLWSVIRPSGEWRLQIGHGQESGGYPGSESQQTSVAGFSNDWIHPKLQWLLNPWQNGWRLESSISGRVGLDLFHWSNSIDGLGYSAANEEYQAVGTRDLRAEGALRIFGEWQKPYACEFHVTGIAEQLDPHEYPLEPLSWRWRLQRHAITGAGEASWAPRTWLGIRFNAQGTAALDHNTGGILRTSYPDTMLAQSQSHWMPAMQGMLRLGNPSKNWQTHLSVGHHYRIPELRELFSTSLGMMPNPDLRPEQGENLELALAWNRPVLHVQTAIFWNQLRDGIRWIHGGGFTKPENLSLSRTQGLEVEAQWHPHRRLDVIEHGTLQSPENLSKDAAYHGKQLPNEAALSAGAEIRLRVFTQWELSYNVEAQSEVYRDQANQMRIPPQVTHGFTIAWSPMQELHVRANVLNITDTQYQDIYSALPTPGRQFSLCLTQVF